jgi:ribosomal protein S18 acetylase RimI-like enzyme
MTTNIIIKSVTADDLLLLQTISRQTFTETFSAQNTDEDMKKYLEENLSLKRLAKELNNADSIFYFAWQDENVIGYLKMNFGQSQTELQDNKSVEIERIYVLKKFHGQKVGQLLYDKAIEVARQRNASYIWLGVWERNERALAFYNKNGFVEFDKHIFKLGSDEQTDIMMKRYL